MCVCVCVCMCVYVYVHVHLCVHANMCAFVRFFLIPTSRYEA